MPPLAAAEKSRQAADALDAQLKKEARVAAAGVGPPQADAVDPLIGTHVGSFKVVRKLGIGGMGTVYLGEQAFIGSKVAIKVLHRHLANNASLVQRFYAEARAANVIGHEHIVNIIDLNLLPPDRYYFIMEYLEGLPLSELPRPVPHPLLVHVLSQVCDALQAAHDHGVVHRDLKPENVILIKRGRNEHFVKVLDFGIAKLFAVELAGQRTAAGVIMGTPEFMAPEQTSAENVDGRTDIYSLGVIAYELATGQLPFLGKSVADLLIAHRMTPAKPPHEVNRDVPLALSQVIMKALAKLPGERWQSAEELRLALEATLPARGDAFAAPGLATPGAGTPAYAPPAPPGVRTTQRPALIVPPGAPGLRSITGFVVPGSGKHAVLNVVEDAGASATASAGPASGPPPGEEPSTGFVLSPGPSSSASSLRPVEARGGFGDDDGTARTIIHESATSSSASSLRQVGSRGSGKLPAHVPAAPAEQGASGVRAPPVSSPSSVGASGFSSSPSAVRGATPASRGPAGSFSSSPSSMGSAPASRGSAAGYSSSPSSMGGAPASRGSSVSSSPSGMRGMTPGPRHAPGQGATPTAGPEVPTSSPSTGTWEVKVFDAPGGQARTLQCTDLSRGGMFLHTEGAVPPMFARFKVALVLPDGEFALKAEVVRHVTVDQSRAWNMPVGFGVQFIELTPAQRDDLANLARGLPRFQSAAQRAEEKDDARAEEVLGPWVRRLSGSHYELLRAADDVDFPEVRHLVREARKALEALAARPLSARQRDQLEAVERRFDLAMTALGQPRNRLDYDAGRANWKGVARCIAGGVSVSELDAARRRYLELHPRVEGNAHLHFTTGSAWESQSVLERALAEFEKALTLDPLNLAYHQRHQAARRAYKRPS